MPFFGFYDYVPSRVDQRDEYRRLLGLERFGVYSKKELVEKLAFAEQFPPTEPLEKILTHKVEIYDGAKNYLTTIDFAQELQHRRGESIERIVERGIIIKLTDRTFVRGDKIELVNPNAENVDKAEPYLKICFDDFDRKHMGYSFSFRKEMFSQHPQFHVTTTFVINGVLWEQSEKIGRVVTEKRRDRRGSLIVRYNKDPSFKATYRK